MGAIERTRKVLVSLSLEWTSNREFLKGVSRYVSLNADWKITFVSPRELSQLEDLPRPDACGYENLSYVKTLFRRRFGMTMTEFRSSSVD